MSKKSFEELKQSLENATSRIKIGSIYSHYKNSENTYTILDVVIIEATNEVGVIYGTNYNDLGVKFLRPLDEFLGEVEFENKIIPRFKLVS